MGGGDAELVRGETVYSSGSRRRCTDAESAMLTGLIAIDVAGRPTTMASPALT